MTTQEINNTIGQDGATRLIDKLGGKISITIDGADEDSIDVVMSVVIKSGDKRSKFKAPNPSALLMLMIKAGVITKQQIINEQPSNEDEG